MLQKLIILLTVLLFTSNLFGQLYEVNLQEKIRNASFIVEGEVTKSESYLGSDNEIYTANEVVVYKDFKGTEIPERITVITLGGTVGDETTTWTHLLSLSVGDSGVFFLEDSERPEPNNLNVPPSTYNVYASSQGFLKYSFEEEKVTANAPFWYSENIETDVYNSFRQDLGTPVIYFVPDWEKERKCIVFKFDLRDPQTSGFPIELSALVSVKSNIGEFYLRSAAVIAKYDTEVLGGNIVQNGALQLSNIGISNSNNYLKTATDTYPDQVMVKIDFDQSSGSVSNMAVISESFQPLINLKLSLQQIADPNIILDSDQMLQNSEIYNTVTQKSERISCIEVEGDFDVKLTCSPPVITSFTTSFLPPNTARAGTQDTLTIIGMCFDSIRGTSEVEFTDANTGPMPVNWVAPLDGDYVLWSDTLIKVLVPSNTKTSIANSAGTGKFRINRQALGIEVSATDLIVPFAAINNGTGPFTNPPSKSLQLHVSNINGFGGQSIYYASSFKADTNAVKAFERGLENWRCSTFINYIVQDSTAIPNLLRAGKIEYDTLPVGAVTTLAQTQNQSIQPCVDPANFFEGATRRRFTIKFNSRLTWHTDTLMPVPLPANTFDLESRAVHELGHSHLLNHSNNINDLMYFTDAVAPLEYRRTINQNDEDGGKYVVNISVNPPASCPAPMIALLPNNCTLITSTIELNNEESIFAEIYPNPTQGNFSLSIEYEQSVSNLELEYRLFSIVGTQIASNSVTDTNTVINASQLGAGLYLLSLTQDGKVIKTFKIVKN